MIDARKHHDPESAPGLIERAIQVVGTQNELATRLGVRRQTIHYIRTGRHAMSYGMQVMLEGVVEGVSGAKRRRRYESPAGPSVRTAGAGSVNCKGNLDSSAEPVETCFETTRRGDGDDRETQGRWEMSTSMEEKAKEIVGIEGWYPYRFELVENGILVTGAVFDLVTRGPRKGQPNFRKMDRSTKKTVIISPGE